MHCSAQGLAFIAAHEGFVGHVYKDSGGLDTIGFGHLLRPGETFPNGLTHDQALTLLASDVAWAERAVGARVTSPLSQASFDALVSLVFNIGAGAFWGSTLLQKLNAGDYAAAADEFLRWDKVDGQPNAELRERRRAERAVFLEDVVTSPDSPIAIARIQPTPGTDDDSQPTPPGDLPPAA